METASAAVEDVESALPPPLAEQAAAMTADQGPWALGLFLGRAYVEGEDPMPRTLTTPAQTETRNAWLGDHPIAGSVVIALLTGIALQLTHMIDFQERVAEVVGWTVSVRFIDFGFRTAMGALVVLAVLPRLFGYARSRPWFGEYLGRLRLTGGPAPRLTLAISAASVVIMAALMAGVASRFDGLRSDLDSVLDDSVWFIVVLSLVPGIWEELAFRGLMLSNLQQRYHPWMGILISSVFFGLFHISNLLLRDLGQVSMEMIMAASVSIGWGYAVVKTGSVLPAMVSHYFINVFIEVLLDPDLSDSAGAVIFGGLTIVYPILTIIAAWWISRRHHRAHLAPEPPSRPAPGSDVMGTTTNSQRGPQRSESVRVR